MPNINSPRILYLLGKGVKNLLLDSPLAISLEITHSCNCNCRHCDKGGVISSEKLAPSKRFGELVRELQPLVAQISGGEPLLRDDVYQIISEIKINKYFPYIVFVTNGSLLDEKKYHLLKCLGVDEFAISLDFPDERHDENRGRPGLYNHLNEMIPYLTRLGNKDISIISVIRSNTLSDLTKLADQAKIWNTAIVFSAYTPLRTHEYSDAIQHVDQLKQLRVQIDYFKRNRRNMRIITSDSVMDQYYRFFSNECYLSQCKAGYRSLVINPDGRLAPCAMQPYSFSTHKQLIEEFSKHNTCGACYVSLRANTERKISTFLKDSVSLYSHLREATS